MSFSVVEAGEPLELRRVWLTNMQLLGFDTDAYEEKFKVALSKDMFAHINKKGSEVVMYFLFSRLDSHMAYEEFRDCWPIFDKKQETQFRRSCSNWLAKIAKEEPSSRLPRLANSLLLSPGGDKFYHFLLRFSCYVLKKVCLREAKPEEKHVFLSSFITSPESHAPALKDVSAFAVKAHTVRHTQNVVKRTVLVTKLHKEWETYASELVEEYRSYTKEIKQLKKKLDSLQEEKKRQVQASVLAGSPRRLQSAGLKASDKVLSLSAEVAAQKRHSRMEKVRGMWRSLEGFYDKSSHQREVVSSVLHGQANAHSIDANDIVFQVSEMLLPEYEALNREGKVANTYEAGKLNIISLIELWNCSLKVLRDKLLQKELPSFEAELQYVSEALQTQRANLTTTKNLRVSLLELHSSLDTTIAELEKNLRSLRKKNSFQGGREGEEEEGAPVLHIPPITVPSLGLDLLPPSPKKPLPTFTGIDQAERQPPLPVNLSWQTDEVSTPEAVHNISRSVHQASCQRHHYQHHQLHSASKQGHTSKLRAPQVKLGKPNASLHLPRTGDLSIFNDESPTHTSPKSTLSSTLTPVSVSTGLSSNDRTTDRLKSTRKSSNLSNNNMVDGSSKVKPRPLKPKVLKSSTKEPPKSPLTSGRATSSTMSQSRTRKSTKPRVMQTSGYQSSPLAVHKMTAASSGSGRGKVGGTGTREDKENTTPLLMSMPKAHDILAEQIAVAVADGDGLENSDLFASTPEGQVHSFANPISAMRTDAFVVRDKIPRTPISKSVKRTQGSANSSVLLQSPSLKSASPQSSNLLKNLCTPPEPSPLATDLSRKLNLSSPAAVQRTPAHIETLQSQDVQNLINVSPSPLLDSQRPNPEQKEKSVTGVSSNKSPPSPRLPPDDGLDLEQSIETPPATSQHTSLNESHLTVEEKERDGERENGDEDSVSEQMEGSPQPKLTPDHSPSSSGSTTPEPSPLPLERTSEELISQHTPSSQAQGVSQWLQSDTSVASSSRKVAFSTEGVTPPASTQLGLFSPGSLHQGGLSFQTPPSASSYQLMSELPPTPFQDANFDLDSSSESEHEEEEHHLSHESGSSFDSSYSCKLQEKVEALISQEDVEASSNYDLEGVISRADLKEPRPKLVDIEGPPSFPNDLQPSISHRGVVGSSGSLKVDDLLDLDSPLINSSPHVPQRSPSLNAYHSPQVGLLVDIGTPGSNLSARPLLTSTALGHQGSANSQGQRGQVLTPMSDILLPYLPSHSGTQSGALISGSVNSGHTWSSLKSSNSGSPFLVSPPNTAAEKLD